MKGDGWALRPRDSMLHGAVISRALTHTLVTLPVAWSFSALPLHSGDGWASRLEDSMLHGAVPVLVQDGVAEKFHGVIDYAAVSVRIAEADLEKVQLPIG